MSGNALSLGFNLIGETDGGNTVWLSNDIKGTSANPQSPGLDPNGPTDNGGLTFTIKLVTGSKAYHNGNPARGRFRRTPTGLYSLGHIRNNKPSALYDPDRNSALRL